MDEAYFLQQLHDALSHVHDLPFYQSHPLCKLLGHSSTATPALLQQALLEGIEQLRPPSHIEPEAPRWRRYRYLKLRYVDGASLEYVSAVLGVGERQARRENRGALEGLAATLSKRLAFFGLPAAVATNASPEDSSLEPRTSPVELRERQSAEADAVELDQELSRAETQPHSEEIELRTALEDAIRLTGVLAATSFVTTEYDLVAPSLMVTATRTILRQILLNVMTYLISLGSGNYITVIAADGADSVELRFGVSLDYDGAGSPSGNRVSAASSPALVTARRLVEEQGGVLQIEWPSVGNMVAHLYIPAVKATLVLVVDDNPDVARLFRRLLRGSGFRVAQARNGVAALELAQSLQPDVITLDLMLPEQDGWDLFQQLRDDPSTATIPIVACSILPERELALSLGANGFIPKPITPEVLLAELRPYRRTASS